LEEDIFETLSPDEDFLVEVCTLLDDAAMELFFPKVSDLSAFDGGEDGTLRPLRGSAFDGGEDGTLRPLRGSAFDGVEYGTLRPLRGSAFDGGEDGTLRPLSCPFPPVEALVTNDGCGLFCPALDDMEVGTSLRRVVEEEGIFIFFNL
jgi:hypothetical protein